MSRVASSACSRRNTLSTEKRRSGTFRYSHIWPRLRNQPDVMWLRSVFCEDTGTSDLNSGNTLSIITATLESATFNPAAISGTRSVSYTHLRAHETRHDLVCRLLLEK